MFNNSCYLKKSYDKKYQSSDKSCQFNLNIYPVNNDIGSKSKLNKNENFKDLFNKKYDINYDRKS